MAQMSAWRLLLFCGGLVGLADLWSRVPLGLLHGPGTPYMDTFDSLATTGGTCASRYRGARRLRPEVLPEVLLKSVLLRNDESALCGSTRCLRVTRSRIVFLLPDSWAIALQTFIDVQDGTTPIQMFQGFYAPPVIWPSVFSSPGTLIWNVALAYMRQAALTNVAAVSS